jgi:Excalibur calcium-binding domain
MQLPRSRRLTAPILALFLTAAAVTAQPAVAFHDRDCSDFRTHRQAQHFFETHNPRRDPHNLDGDNDGIACEELP